MYTVRGSLTTTEQLRLAVRMQSPATLARLFAAHAGQFYDRGRFDALARAAHNLYAAAGDEEARQFRRRLDRRLCERNDAPVAWDRRER